MVNISHENGMFPHFYATCNTSLHYRVFNAFWWFFCQRLRPSILLVHLLMKLITWWLLDFLTYFAQFWLNLYVHIYVMIGKLPELFMFRDPFNAKSIFEYRVLMILTTSSKNKILKRIQSPLQLPYYDEALQSQSLDSSNYLFPVQILSCGKCLPNGQFDDLKHLYNLFMTPLNPPIKFPVKLQISHPHWFPLASSPFVARC